MTKKEIGQAIFLACVVASMLATIYWGLGVAPADKEQGDIQRIFYVHMGSIWPAFVAYVYVLIGSILYLKTRNPKYDQHAYSAALVGVSFGSMVLITGPIWAKPTWGIYWTWDARLSSMFFLWLIILSYVMLKSYIEDEAKRARISAVLGIISGLMVPFVYMSTRWFETQHPKPVIMGDEDSGIMDPNMVYALLLALLAFSLLSLFFWKRGLELLNSESTLKALKRRVSELEDVQ